jgi:hypothetical protein
MSHHGQNPFNEKHSELMRKLMSAERQSTGDPLRDMQRTLQGEFPDGRLNTNDEGALAVMIGHEKGKVVMQFPVPTAWIGFTPEQAMDIAQTLITHARKAGIVGVYTLHV